MDDRAELVIYSGIIDGLHRVQITEIGRAIQTKNVCLNEIYFPAGMWGGLNGDDEAFDFLCVNEVFHGSPLPQLHR